MPKLYFHEPGLAAYLLDIQKTGTDQDPLPEGCSVRINGNQ